MHRNLMGQNMYFGACIVQDNFSRKRLPLSSCIKQIYQYFTGFETLFFKEFQRVCTKIHKMVQKVKGE